MNTINYTKKYLLFVTVLLGLHSVKAQTLTLEDALNLGMANYGTLKAKEHYIDAAQQTVDEIKRSYLPNFNLAAQQTYGTINGQNGPLYGSGGLGVASSGLPLPEQNWNAAFGALYLANINWDFFTFGKTRSKIRTAKANASLASVDLEQEQFKQQVKIASHYLNLLASHRLIASQKRNLERAKTVLQNASTLAKNGLLPKVDATLAAAEVSKAKIALNQLMNKLKTQNNQLANAMGVAPSNFTIDTNLVYKTPLQIQFYTANTESKNPVLKFYQSKITVGNEVLNSYKKEQLPSLSLFGVFQSRGSGFDSGYNNNQNLYTSDYWKGIDPTRNNYLMGIGFRWNLTDILRIDKKITAQKFTLKGVQEEYNTLENELKTQQDAAQNSLKIALQNLKEAPVQVKAAQQAYKQRLALYSNGLTNMVDVTQALYVLNRAETDLDVIRTNVWQALLLQAASAGDLTYFTNQIKQQ
ncbi:TolC family protein [Ochrovirga pacifica]|uniref:TolC family protein n=1 Tax=Ochrovirga pacifica TaxID=1042376 RepID=UPI0002558793|nr:TolC family protein [Ochrovirga pacifica]